MSDKIAFTQRELQRMDSGICLGCDNPLPLERDRLYTCDNICHKIWVQRLVMVFGETKEVIDLTTGLTHIVPTVVILETGITPDTLRKYPVK